MRIGRIGRNVFVRLPQDVTTSIPASTISSVDRGSPALEKKVDQEPADAGG